MSKEDKYVYKLINKIMIVTMYFANLFLMLKYEVKELFIVNIVVLVLINIIALVLIFLMGEEDE